VLGTNQTGSTDERIMMSGPHSSDGELTRSQATYTVTSSLLGAGNIKTRTVGLTRGHDKTQLLSITRLTPAQTYKLVCTVYPLAARTRHRTNRHTIHSSAHMPHPSQHEQPSAREADIFRRRCRFSLGVSTIARPVRWPCPSHRISPEARVTHRPVVTRRGCERS
jgi:hypothetical protein